MKMGPGRSRSWITGMLLAGGLAGAVQAATPYFVDSARLDDAGDGQTWETAKKTIQAAVNLTGAGDTVWVTNGTYSVTNQITITNAVSLRSINGPDETIIRRQSGDIRVMELTDTSAGAVVSGFTVREGDRADMGLLNGGNGIRMTANATITNCVICNNTFSGGNGPARYGGGVYMTAGTIAESRIANNSGQGNYWGDYGGGVYMTGGTLRNCIITNNSILRSSQVVGGGGGVFATGGEVVNCLLAGNIAELGGGYRGAGRLMNCTVVANGTVKKYTGDLGLGAGLYGETGITVSNTIVYANTNQLGGASDYAGTVNFRYSCTTPLPAGEGNRSDNPGFVNPSGGNYRLRPGSPAVDGGTNMIWMTDAMDLDGQTRLYPAGGTNDMGAYEYRPGEPLQCYFYVDFTAVSSQAVFTATAGGTNLEGLVYYWDFNNDGVFERHGSDLALVTNVFDPGSHSVSLTVSNMIGEVDSFMRPACITVSPTLMFVSLSGTHDIPYTNWTTAATNFQAAADIAASGTVIRVADGDYSLAQTLSIPVGLTLESVNGPDITTLRRGAGVLNTRVLEVQSGAVGAVVSGLTICDGNRTGHYEEGSGIRMLAIGTITNCIIRNNTLDGSYTKGAGISMTAGLVVNSQIINNSAKDSWWGTSGGGIYLGGGEVRNCTITNNSSGTRISGTAAGGGGVYGAANTRLVNCLLAFNMSDYGAGYRGAGGLVENCTIAGNAALPMDNSDPGYAGIYGAPAITVSNTIVYANTNHLGVASNYAGTVNFRYSCTTPLPGAGTGNIDDDPLFENAAAGDYRLKRTSPCIDKGTNQVWMIGTLDLAGQPRFLNESVDMGAYEIFVPWAGTVFLVQ